MVMLKFTEADHRLVTEAVTRAEQASDGEIVTIVAEKSDSYHDVGLHYAVLAMLLVPAALAFLPQWLIDWAMGLFLGWNAMLTRGALMAFLFVKLAGVFLVVRYALAYMPLRMALTPGSTKSRRVRRRAVELFRVGAERRTTGRTGILLYLSLREHRAEIVADEAIHSKVEPDIWGEAMADLVEEVKARRPGSGMAKAVERIGAVLTEHFPKSHTDQNELPDRLIEL
jgi:putative membrane protein